MQLLKNGLIYNGVGYPQDLSAFSKKKWLTRPSVISVNIWSIIYVVVLIFYSYCLLPFRRQYHL